MKEGERGRMQDRKEKWVDRRGTGTQRGKGEEREDRKEREGGRGMSKCKREDKRVWVDGRMGTGAGEERERAKGEREGREEGGHKREERGRERDEREKSVRGWRRKGRGNGEA